jgi:hypothetical protein
MSKRLPDVYVDDQLAELVARLAADHGMTYAAVCRWALTLLIQLESERAVRASRAGTARRCVVCQQPRRADGVADAMAHAQCDQIVSNLERTASAT